MRRKMTRGYRNHNPLNIRKGQQWLGLTQGKDQDFCSFSSPEYGYRAAWIIMHTYYRKGYNTIEKIISRWAPRTENNTEAYVKFVCHEANCKPQEPLPDPSEQLWYKWAMILYAMTIQENGCRHPTLNLWQCITDAWQMAFE